MPKEVSIQSVFQDLVLSKEWKQQMLVTTDMTKHVETLKQKVLEDAQRNGQALEESKKNGGLTGKMSEGLLNLDKWIRGLD